MPLRLILIALALASLGGTDVPPPVPLVPAAERTTTPVAKSDPGWLKAHESYARQARAGRVEIAFFGDSITQGWWSGGASLWRQHLEPQRARDFGIGGDTTQLLLWRLENGELEGMKPRAVVLMIGTNNLWDRELTPQHIAAGVARVLATIHRLQPQARILLMGVPPVGRSASDPMRPRIRAINALLAAFTPTACDAFLDLGPLLLGADGTFPDSASTDKVHLTAEGYGIWYEAMKPILQRLLAGQADPGSP